MSDATVRPLSPAGADDEEPIVVGTVFTGFLERVAPEASRTQLSSDVAAILTSCRVSASQTGRRTGLVVGRVQSGKTLSYEGVIAMARDNGFALVVVISGIANNLLDQGVRRLRKDLGEADPNGWTFLVNAQADLQAEATLRSIRDNWNDPSTPALLKKTAVCLLLKHHGRIDGFRDLCQRIGWSGQKVLIIDDEADQASLNISFRRGRESATYRNISALRDEFPHHAYLQYTATPQAPLLIAITDALSPDFVRVLEPGAAYVGGGDYFDGPNPRVNVISPADLALAADPNGPPPGSLTVALREFMLGASDVLAKGTAETRSMLVHPSRLTEPHATFVRWVKTIVGFWRGVLDDDDDPAGLAELRSQFELAWRSLRATDPQISEFVACWSNLRFVLRNLQLVEMNTRDTVNTPLIEWDSTKSYILVGGQALDRGFTVDGLSVTYMTRDPGGWTADTIQQRARFFGYKRAYFNQCRVYLEPTLRDAFEKYVQHEHQMIASLTRVQDGASSLKEWKRHFLLDPAMKATRQSVVAVPTIRVAIGERWIFDPRPPGTEASSDEAIEFVRDALAQYTQIPDEFGHTRTHLPARDMLDLMDVLPANGDELPQDRALKLQMAKLIDEDASVNVCLILMRPNITSLRTMTASGHLQPFQGRSSNYPGDREIYDPEHVTVQVHRFGVRRVRDEDPFGSLVTLAFWTPQDLAEGWLVEGESA